MEGPTCFIKTDRTPDKFPSSLATFLEDHPEIRNSVVGVGSTLREERATFQASSLHNSFAASPASILHPQSSRFVEGLSFTSYNHHSPAEISLVGTSIGEDILQQSSAPTTKGHFIESILGRKARERMNRGKHSCHF